MRRALAIVVIALAAWVAGAVAQSRGPVPKVGVLYLGPPAQAQAFVEGLRELGYADGRTIALVDRFADGDRGRLGPLAAELVASGVQVIVAFGTAPTRAARAATATIPIVMGPVSDPVGSGFVAALARPGGNVTGVSLMLPELVGKQLEVLKDALPRATRVGVLYTSDPEVPRRLDALEAAAPLLGLALRPMPVDGPDALPGVFQDLAADGVDAIFVLANPDIDAMRREIAALATRHRLPGLAQLRRYAEDGLLMSYGPNIEALHRRTAVYVDKVLRGANPADLPVEQPGVFELTLNLKTAGALGLALPQTFIARADEVIE